MFLFFKNSHFVPDLYKETVFDVDYKALYEQGIRLILSDLDNTLISYKESDPNEALYKFIKDRTDEGFEVILVSNNSHKKRVSYFSEKLGITYVNFALKPLKLGFKRALKKASRKYKKSEIMAIGDQLMTDVLAAKRSGYFAVLVKAIDRKTEIFTTRFNRRLERHAINVIKKKNYALYETNLKEYEEYGKN